MRCGEDSALRMNSPVTFTVLPKSMSTKGAASSPVWKAKGFGWFSATSAAPPSAGIHCDVELAFTLALRETMAP